jgi:hypothetical protein
VTLFLFFPCGQDSGELVVERREEGPVAPVTMNAFELISTSQGLNLSTLFEKQMVCSTWFLNLVVRYLIWRNLEMRTISQLFGCEKHFIYIYIYIYMMRSG